MSAVIIFVSGDAATMFTDGVTYDNDNRILSIAPKAYPLPHLNCVVNIRGPQDFAADFVPRLARVFTTFESLVDGLPLAAEVAWECAPAAVQTYGGCEIYIAGYSHERGQAEAHVVTNNPAYGEGWRSAEIDTYASAPGVPIDGVPDDTLEAAIAIMERQRARRDEHGNGGVGGFVQMTQVTPLATHTSVIHRWLDRPGDCLRDAA